MDNRTADLIIFAALLAFVCGLGLGAITVEKLHKKTEQMLTEDGRRMTENLRSPVSAPRSPVLGPRSR